MKNRQIKFNRALSLFLVLMVIFAAMPATMFSTSAAAADPRVVDASTMDSWKEMFPENSTESAGGVWTDKSVFKNVPDEFKNLKDLEGKDISVTMQDEDNDFLVALSALSSNKSITGYSYTPTDTMLVLDVSNSMGPSTYQQTNNDVVPELVEATNHAITKLLSLNNHNRVGVVLYSGNSNVGSSETSTATVLLPLGRYTAESSKTVEGERIYQFLVSNNNRNKVSVRDGVRTEGSETEIEKSKNVSGGTYIQNGIDKALDEFLAADTIILDGEIQAGTTRTPIFVLMSDGNPTAGTSSFNSVGKSNLGDGTTPNDTLGDVLGFVTQLTATYAKNAVDKHYAATTPLFYTLGLGVSSDSTAAAVLNPSGYKDSYGSIDEHWENYLNTTNNSSLILAIEDGKNPDTTAVKKLETITSASQAYVDEYFPAVDDDNDGNVADELIEAFGKIVNQIIIQSLYYPTHVESGDYDMDGFLTFVDQIGHYMEVKEIEGIVIGDRYYSGAALSKNFNSAGHEFGTIAAPPTSVMNLSGRLSNDWA